MDFNFSDEQRMLAEAARRYVRERCTLEKKREMSRTADGFSRVHWADFANMGWLALPVPEALGGLGGGPVEMALLMEEFGRGLVNEPVVESSVLCGALLAQAQGRPTALLEALAAGDAIVTLAHMEGGDRSEFEARVASHARRDGDCWRLSGTKHLVRHGASASHWLATARIDGHEGFALFAVERNAAGATVQSHLMIDGTYAADLHFEDVALSADALLLMPDKANTALQSALNQALLALCAAAIGSMEAVMAMTADYLKTRVQYGQPLARFQALQHRMAEMFVETDQSRAALYRAIAAVETGEPLAAAQALSAAKWLISRAGLFVSGQGIQLHGGIGVTEEYAVGHHYKAMVSFDKRLGDADFHLLRSSELFEMHA
ncbi:MAG: putative acyl-CoA dehydrogenase [Polaromonas sp.]|nr:putative acyl-CoA dehydrogenase [Polaromonas sp.]